MTRASALPPSGRGRRVYILPSRRLSAPVRRGQSSAYPRPIRSQTSRSVLSLTADGSRPWRRESDPTPRSPRSATWRRCVVAGCSLLAGCGGGPGRIAAPDWDPPEQAAAILSQFDKNGDGFLDAQELTATPGLASGAKLIDADSDGKLSAAELETQFAAYRDQRIGLRTPAFRLTYKGRGVPEAEVRFTPEPFLEGLIEPATAVTDIDGLFYPQSEGQDVPGVRLGYYRVQITSPRAKIPEKYTGPESPLGTHVSMVDASSYGLNAVTELKLTD